MGILQKIKNLFLGKYLHVSKNKDVNSDETNSFNKPISIFVRKESEKLVEDVTRLCPYILEEMQKRGTARRVLSGDGSPIKQKVIDLPLYIKIFVRSDVRDELLNVDAEEKIQDELSILISKENRIINHLANQRAALVEIWADEMNIIEDEKQWYQVVKPLPLESDTLAEIVDFSTGRSIFKIGKKPRVLLCGSAPDCDIIISKLPLYHAKIEILDKEEEFNIRSVNADCRIKVKDNIGEPKQLDYNKPYPLKRIAKIWFRYASHSTQGFNDVGPFIFRERNKAISTEQMRLILEDKEDLDDLLETRIHSKSEFFKESEYDESDNEAYIENKDGLEIKIAGIVLYEIGVHYRIGRVESLSRGEQITLEDNELMGEVKCTQTDDFWIFEDEKRYGCLFDDTGRPVDWLQIPLRSENKNLAIGSTKMRYQSLPQIAFQSAVHEVLSSSKAKGTARSHATNFPIVGKLAFIDKKCQARKANIIDKGEQIRIGRLYHLKGYKSKAKDYILSEKIASRNHALVDYDKEKEIFYIENVSQNNMIIALSEGLTGKAEFVEPGQRYFFPSGTMTRVWIGHTIFEIRGPKAEFMQVPKISEYPTLME